MSRLSHLGDDGRARMVDVSDKPDTVRTATATGRVRCNLETLEHVRANTAPKGAVVSTAELAGVMAAKRTSDLIPLCHPLALTKVGVAIGVDDNLPGFIVEAEVRTTGPTGVEMEALTAVSVACLTLFDMLKAVDRSMVIEAVRVTSKRGGRSGDWQADIA
jgi:cyclic pyranopterin phosphate synthase